MKIRNVFKLMKNKNICRACCDVDATLIWKPSVKLYAGMSMEEFKVCNNCFEMLKAEEESEILADLIKCDGADLDSIEYLRAEIEAELEEARRQAEN